MVTSAKHPGRIVLGLESSCDETAVALVREDGTILAQALRSQTAEHRPYGGVVPEIAARAHLQHIDDLYHQAFTEAGLTLADVDAIAVTAGPGLIGGVIVGVMLAKGLAAASGKPLIAVNHLEGHALTVRMTHGVAFPYFLLLVSGGHCQMLVVRGVGDYQLLGQTKDDALGEAFDKCAKMLGLGYPGGPAIERAAQDGDPHAYALPRPMLGSDTLDFSFSGLKTAVRLLVEKESNREAGSVLPPPCGEGWGGGGEVILRLDAPLPSPPRKGEGTTERVASAGLTPTTIANIAASFQQAAFDAVADRVTKALTLNLQGQIRVRASVELTAFVIAGGVAANQALWQSLEAIAAAHGLPLVVAPPALCTDNAAMIAWAGMERLKLGLLDDLTIEPRARWPLVGSV